MLEQSGLSVWQPEDALRAAGGAALNEEIASTLAQSQIVIVMLAAQSAASPYCRAEIIYAMELGRRILVLDIELLAALPDVLMPLRGYATTRIPLYATPRADWPAAIARGLAICGLPGIALALGSSEIDPDARIIHPPYPKLAMLSALDIRALAVRLSEAVRLSASNGYLQMDLALLLLHQSDAAGAVEAGRRAVALIPEAPDAHYALALAECAAAPAATRAHVEAEAILRRLAVARRLAGACFHIDLLSALVIANNYLTRYLTPPADPAQLLAGGVKGLKRIDPGENSRVLDREPLLASPETARLREAVAAYR